MLSAGRLRRESTCFYNKDGDSLIEKGAFFVSKDLTRRSFLKGAAAGAAGVAALGVLNLPAMAREEPAWDQEADVVIVGSGGTGVAAAAAAAESGASALILEKAGVAGGTTNFSGGVMQAAGTQVQKELTAYQDDTPEKHAQLWIKAGEGLVDEELVRDLGVVPVRLAYDDVYSALAKGEIDGAENNWPSYDYTGHFEVAKYMLVDGHTRIPELLLASAEAMDKLAALDPGYPALVQDCARQAGLLERELWQQTEAASEQRMREAGVTVTTLDAGELALFEAAVAPLYAAYGSRRALIARIRSARRKES